jgi:DNA primase
VQETIENFQLGYVDSPISGDEMYKGRLAIPYLTISGTVSMRFKRVVPDSSPKMLALPGDIGRPYNVGALYSSGQLYIVEGEPDVWTAWQLGLHAIGFPGVKSWKRVYRRIFRHWNITVLADGDEPGIEFARKVATDLSGAAQRCKIIAFPDGEDLGSMHETAGPQGVYDWLGI